MDTNLPDQHAPQPDDLPGEHSADVAQHVSEVQAGRVSVGQVQTGAGSIVHIGGTQHYGDNVAGDKITIITEEQAYHVQGLPNPYRGLESYRYEDCLAYGGREADQHRAVEMLAAPEAPQGLFFITGSSGSGKSSFVQAGLLPALEEYYEKRHIATCRAVFRPSMDPLARLADALQQLGLPVADLQASNGQAFGHWLGENTSAGQVNLLVVDQFEECFTQSSLLGRDRFFALLSGLPPFSTTRTHVLITLRSDYLNELFEVKPLWKIAIRGIDLRAMGVDELRMAILKPLQAAGRIDESYRQKRFEPDLLERLAHETSQEVGYLPLLQVTLQAMWNSGSLRLGGFRCLADAIQDWAEAVYEWEDYATPHPNKPRPQADRDEILAILLELIDVAPDGDPRRDVRLRRLKSEVLAGSIQRARLVSDLTSARLLIASTEGAALDSVETLDIVHETLITRWKQLHQAVAEQREILQQRGNFEQHFAEWKAKGQGDQYLLSGVRLAEAQKLAYAGDISLRSAEARRYVNASIAQAEAAQQREMERMRVLARTQRQRTMALAAGLAVALLLAMVAFYFAWQSQRQSRTARAGYLASQAKVHLRDRPDLAFLLSAAGYQVEANFSTRDGLLTALTTYPHLHGLLGKHTHSVSSVAFSPDGKTLAVGGGGAVILWDVASRRPIGKPFAGHTGFISGIAFSPDGQTLASASADNTIILWDVASGRPKGQPLAGHIDWINCVAFSPDGRTLASGGEEGTIILWDVTSREPIGQPLIGHTLGVNSIAFSPDGRTLASGSTDDTIILWDVESGKPKGQPLQGDAGIVMSVAFSPDGQTLASGNENSTIFLWKIAPEKPERLTLAGHDGVVTSLAFSPNGQTLASGSADKTVLLWDVVSRKLIGRPFTGHSEVVFTVAFSPDGQMVASGSFDGAVFLWDVSTWRPIDHLLPGPTGSVSSVAFSPDGKTLFSASGGDTVILWEVASGKPKSQFPVGDHCLGGNVAFSPDGKTLVSNCGDSPIVLWDIVSGKPKGQFLHGDTGQVGSLAFNLDGKILASGGQDGTIILWDVARGEPIGQPLAEHTSSIHSVVFSPDGQTLASGSRDKTIILWNVASRKPKGQPLTGHTDRVISLAFSPDGRTLVSVSTDKTIILWDIASGKPKNQASFGHTGDVRSIAFSSDGQTLASSSGNEIILWDRATLLHVGLPLFDETGNITNLAFSPDGKTLSSGAVLWDVDPASWLEKACQMAGRNFSQEEWALYMPEQAYDRVCPQWP